MRTVGIAQTLAERSVSTSYDVVGFGVRAHLSSLFAAIGLVQLAEFDQARTIRRRLWRRYAAALVPRRLGRRSGPRAGAAEAAPARRPVLVGQLQAMPLSRKAVGAAAFPLWLAW